MADCTFWRAGHVCSWKINVIMAAKPWTFWVAGCSAVCKPWLIVGVQHGGVAGDWWESEVGLLEEVSHWEGVLRVVSDTAPSSVPTSLSSDQRDMDFSTVFSLPLWTDPSETVIQVNNPASQGNHFVRVPRKLTYLGKALVYVNQTDFKISLLVSLKLQGLLVFHILLVVPGISSGPYTWVSSVLLPSYTLVCYRCFQSLLMISKQEKPKCTFSFLYCFECVCIWVHVCSHSCVCICVLVHACKCSASEAMREHWVLQNCC